MSIQRLRIREAIDLVGIAQSDKEILERLFSMFDQTGSDQIGHINFMVGLAPLCKGTVEEKLACESFTVVCTVPFLCRGKHLSASSQHSVYLAGSRGKSLSVN